MQAKMLVGLVERYAGFLVSQVIKNLVLQQVAFCCGMIMMLVLLSHSVPIRESWK
jgi:hypothetical protein